jgi:hypothetical protein
MPQGSFTASNSGASTTNYTNDTTFYFLGQQEFTGPPDWTAVVDGYTPGTLGPFTSNWIVEGTGGSGKILSITFQIGDFNNKSVVIILQSGGGTFMSGGGNTFSPPLACFVEGTRILTQTGAKAIETLISTDLVLTPDNRLAHFRLKKITVPCTTVTTAPYRIEANAFGPNKPAAPLCLSPTHKVQIRKGVWISPERAAQTNSKVYQYGIGETVTYYHIACDNYLRDNVIAEGIITETLATNKNYKGPAQVYTWSTKLGGFTRISPSVNISKEYRF